MSSLEEEDIEGLGDDEDSAFNLEDYLKFRAQLELEEEKKKAEESSEDEDGLYDDDGESESEEGSEIHYEIKSTAKRTQQKRGGQINGGRKSRD